MSIKHSFERLEELGFSPNSFLDIGACYGQWSLMMKNLYNSADYFMIEAIDYPQLKMTGIPYKISLLSDEDYGVIPFYSRKDTGDSIFRENTSHYSKTEPDMRITETLDSIIDKDKTFDVIKIDCQGAELKILKGGKRVVSNAQVIILELPFIGEFNRGAPTFIEYINYMDSIGFIPFDICEFHDITINNNKKIIIQLDIVFVRKQSNIVNEIQQYINKLGG